MNRWEFMRQLEELLSDISPSEKEEALQYYNDYINDAGKENEEDVIRSLGSPEQVAKTVKDGLLGEDSLGEFTENGYSKSGVTSESSLIKRKETTSEQKEDTQSKKEGLPTWAIVLIVIGCIFLSPVILGLAASAVGFIFSVLAAVVGLVLGTGIAAIVLVIVMFALVIAGIGSMLVEPLAAFALIGAGLVCGALGILFLMLTVFLVGICIPGICKGIAYIFKKLFSKKEVA